MKQNCVKTICSLLAAVFLLSLFPVFAVSFDGAPEVASAAAVVYNLETEDILYSKNLDGRLDPAAFTKLMTSLLSFEYRAKNGNVNVTVTEEMLSSAGGTSMKLQPGEIIPFDSLLSGLVVQNANDAALVLASTVGGNISSFVEQMNDRAKKMGMENTYYSNPTGVDSATMYTTLSDVLLLCKALYRVNDFMLLSETPKIKIPATNLTKERVYTNKNALVPYSYVTDYYMEGVRGMVAGYTSRAGYCVATMREVKNSKYMVVVSGGVDRSEKQNGTDISSYRDAKNLLEWAENTFAVREVIPSGKIICECGVRLASGVDHMILVTGENMELLLPIEADLETEVTTKVETNKKTFTAPIIEGTTYGQIKVFYQGEEIGSVPLVAQSNIGLSRGLVAWDAVKSFFSRGPAKVILILAILAAVFYVLYLFYVLFDQYKKRNEERNRIISEMMEMEKKRMKKVRLAEQKATQARMRKMRRALQAGFQVLQGESEVQETPRGRKNAPVHKAVAKLPEKYRTKPVVPQNRGNASGQRRSSSVSSQKREVYRTTSSQRRPPTGREPQSGNYRKNK